MSSEKKGKSLKSKLATSCEMETPVIPMPLSMPPSYNDGSGCKVDESSDIDLYHVTEKRGWGELTGSEFQFLYEITEQPGGRLVVKRRKDAALTKYKTWLLRDFKRVSSDLDVFLYEKGFNMQAYKEILIFLLHTNSVPPIKKEVEPCLKQALDICKRAVEKYGPKAEDKIQGARRDFVPLQEKPAPQQLEFSPFDYRQLYNYQVLKQMLPLADFFPKKTLVNVIDNILPEVSTFPYHVPFDDRVEELDKLSCSLSPELQDIRYLQKVPLPKKYLDACEGIICTPFSPTESVMNLMTLLYNSSPSRTIPPLLKNLSKIPSNLPLTDCKIVEQDGDYYLDFTTGINKLLEEGRLRLNSALDKDLQGFTLYCTSYDPTKKLLIVSPVEYPEAPTHEFMGDRAFEEALALSNSGQVTVLDENWEEHKVWTSNLQLYEEPNKKASKRGRKTPPEVQGF